MNETISDRDKFYSVTLDGRRYRVLQAEIDSASRFHESDGLRVPIPEGVLRLEGTGQIRVTSYDIIVKVMPALDAEHKLG